MRSFRTELENPVVERDILDLEQKIRLFKEGNVDEEKFRSLRLARGVYGQRQPGVQMIRIKIPYGRMTVRQLRKIADLSDEYASSTLHATTRQDIQIHYVSLDRTPELWHELETCNITLREACGNTVRNITASEKAGIDPEEPFNVAPYAQAMFEYFLRNPICQEMGRKFKIALASSDKDSAFTLIHDVGLIPKVLLRNGKELRGFQVLVGGGLGAQPFLAQEAFDFLEEDRVIPFIAATLRIFDRYGERNRRNKARFKYLLNDIGLEQFLEEVQTEWAALPHAVYEVDRTGVPLAKPPADPETTTTRIRNRKAYTDWLETNVFEQKQKGFFGVNVRVPLGNISSDTARAFADVVERHAADDIRVTINQGYLLRFVREGSLPQLFSDLEALGLSAPGFDSAADITACPGTDTCNLGITNSTGTATQLESVIREEYPDLIRNNDIKIKISGCMNSCGQHGIANIGFHGSSIRHNKQVIPAMQVLLGGGTLGSGKGTVAEKVIKVPTKRTPRVLRTLFDEYEHEKLDGEYFNDFYQRQGKDHFYQLLKPLAELEDIRESDYRDWGKDEDFKPQIGLGECAGVVIDLVQTLILEAEEKQAWAKEAFERKAFADAVYHAYTAYVNGAKALLLGENVRCNTQAGILKDLDDHFVKTGKLAYEPDFTTHVLRMRKAPPSASFAKEYLSTASDFLKKVNELRAEQLKESTN